MFKWLHFKGHEVKLHLLTDEEAEGSQLVVEPGLDSGVFIPVPGAFRVGLCSCSGCALHKGAGQEGKSRLKSSLLLTLPSLHSGSGLLPPLLSPHFYNVTLGYVPSRGPSVYEPTKVHVDERKSTCSSPDLTS